MSCSNPIVAVREPNPLSPGKYRMRFFSNARIGEDVQLKDRFGDSLCYLPCGHCPSCKDAYRKDWAIRCEMESFLHRFSCFVTLTLDDAHYKSKPVKADIQYFLHKLRDSYGIKCRYFCCGELGNKTYRSHYHMILFGFKPGDLKFYGYSKSGHEMFSSKFLNKVWDQGQVLVQDFDFSCAAYVAGYVKKDKNQCFIMESTRPGLGHDYMVNNFYNLFKYGVYQGKRGQVYRLPRYFEKVCDQLGYDTFHIKDDKRILMEDINKSKKFKYGVFQDLEVFSHDGIIMRDKLSKLKRSL